MPNFDGQYELRIFYVTYNGSIPLSHRHTFDVIPTSAVSAGDDFASIYVHCKDGSVDNPLTSKVDTYIELLKDFYHSTATFQRAELWELTPPPVNGTFLSAYDIGEVGDSATPSVPAQQLTMTFRTQGGYILRQQFMEPSIGGEIKDPYPFANVAAKALADFILSDAGFVVARDNTFPILALNASYGQNEKLWRKRFRSS